MSDYLHSGSIDSIVYYKVVHADHKIVCSITVQMYMVLKLISYN